MDVDNKAILLDDERVIKYNKAALIATGSRPKTLPKGVVSESASNSGKVSDFRTISDFQDLYETSKKIGHIVVIGGGFLGSELAVGLASISKNRKTDLKVTQVFPETGVMATVFPEYLSDHVTETLKQELSLNIMPGKLVTSVECKSDQIVVTLDDKSSLEADHVVVAIGATPNSEIAVLGDLEVDPRQKASL